MIVCVISCKEIRSSSKTVPDTMVPVKPYFASKSVEHDVTLTSLLADLSQERTFLRTGCKIDVSVGTESFVTIRLLVQKLLQKNERGGSKNVFLTVLHQLFWASYFEAPAIFMRAILTLAVLRHQLFCTSSNDTSSSVASCSDRHPYTYISTL